MAAQKIGRYEIIRELGRGGMATVYLASDPFFERQVALKVISPKLSEEAQYGQFRARFQREAKVIAALEHASIVPVYDYGEDDGQPYIVMRYMTGGTLADRMHGKPMPLMVVVPIIVRIAEGLQAAHHKGIVHRDLKPGNVLFDAEGHPFISDFGIAKQLQNTTATTSTGTALGTFGYMSPEQAQGARTVDGRADVYALGVILYEMLTGRQPYTADTPVALALQHMTAPIPPLNAARLGLPAELDVIVLRALAKRPEDRYASAEDLAQAMLSVYSPSTVTSSVPTTPASSNRPTVPAAGGAQSSRPTVRAGERLALPRLLTAGGVVVTILLVGLALTFYLTNQSSRTAAATTTAQVVALAQTGAAESVIAAASRVTPTPSPTLTPSPLPSETALPIPTATDTPTPTPTIAPGAVLTSTVDGMVLRYVPAGEFYMGSSRQTDPDAVKNEQPQRSVFVNAFWIDQTEVTNAQFETCVTAGVCTQPTSSRYVDPRYGNYPVVTVTWFQASDYCAWAGRRLPTEAEWEKAARGTGSKRIWPWGNNAPNGRLANYNKSQTNTVAVGSYPGGASPYGALDMAGNAWEWVSDYYAEDYYQTTSEAGINTDPTGPKEGFFRVTRGGAYLSDATYIRLAVRLETSPVRVAGYIGFRCVRAP